MSITKIKALGVTANTITASQIANDTITNTQINTSAAIAQSKMAAITSGNMPNGTTVQTSHATGTDFVGNQNGIQITAGSYVKILEKSITFKTTNPFIYLSTRFGLATVNSAFTYILSPATL